ncbi:MAG: SxtJ family membrane protein [Acidobacteria bacterium]|nr:SxtJ family membrane protein [Acidobacteriota bacterium]
MTGTLRAISRDKARDAGMAFVLLCLLGSGWSHARWLESAAMVGLVVDMIWPAAFTPFAVVWFGLAEVMGAVVSRILLTVLFVGVLTPIGLVRRALGRDPMRLKQWRRGRASVFTVRDHRYTPADLDRPY